eukprot:scaffold3832_cov69-Phaeocystis_antarctica.AAC.6
MPASREAQASGTLGRAMGSDVGAASAGPLASCSRAAAAAARTEAASKPIGPAAESRAGPASRASRNRSSAARAASAPESRSSKMAPTFLAYAPAASGETGSPSLRKQQPVRKLSRPLLRVLRLLGCQPQANRFVRIRAPLARKRNGVVGTERGLHLTTAACTAAEQRGASADDPVVCRQAHEQRDAPDGASQRTYHRDASFRECRHRCLQLRLFFSRHLLVIVAAARLLGAHA